MNYNLALPFFETSNQFPDKTAVVAGERSLSYAELRRSVQRTAAWLRRKAGGRVTRVGILASRNLDTYVGILGACWAGGAYVPLSTKAPEDRLVQLLERTELQALIVGPDSANVLTERVLRACPETVLIAPSENGGELPEYDASDVPAAVAFDDPAYILFTSGTTGTPKGVMIPAGAVTHFVEMMNSRYEFSAEDRIAAITDITFDLSVFDMFVGWSRGASVWAVPHGQAVAPIHFLQEMKATVAFTVPSVAAWMMRMKLLNPEAMPTLRYVLLAGEPLAMSVAFAFQKAAPNAKIDNLYGPTEATVVCSGQQFSGAEDATPERDIVSIGPALPGSEMTIVDEELRPIENGAGELLVTGPQLALGYWGDEEQTRRHFVEVLGRRWYRTGDLAYRDEAGRFHHLGRIDNQVKIRGVRVELEEVEAHLRAVYETESVAAVAWPTQHGSATGIVAFVAAPDGSSEEERKAQLRSRLPAYMIPTAIHHVGTLPLNANGKVDRKALLLRLDESSR
jgi:D-alanine--poly(phosphoribitol) ligase subunit 1